jgi:hypothetical protein
MGVNIQVELLWVVMLWSIMVGCHCFRAPCCLHLQGEMKIEAACMSETFVFYHDTARCHSPGKTLT